jgi:hypothetical protein
MEQMLKASDLLNLSCCKVLLTESLLLLSCDNPGLLVLDAYSFRLPFTSVIHFQLLLNISMSL